MNDFTCGTIYTDEELYNLVKDMPDLHLFPLPKHWYKKYNIPFALPETVKESKENNYAFQKKEYNLPPILIDEPQRDLSGNIILAQLQPEDILKDSIEVVTKPFDSKNTALVGLQPTN